MAKQVLNQEYTICWMAWRHSVFSATRQCFDESHNRKDQHPFENVEFFGGTLCGHNIIIVTLLNHTQPRRIGRAALERLLRRRFPRIQFILQLGVADPHLGWESDYRGLHDIRVHLQQETSKSLLEFVLSKTVGIDVSAESPRASTELQEFTEPTYVGDSHSSSPDLDFDGKVSKNLVHSDRAIRAAQDHLGRSYQSSQPESVLSKTHPSGRSGTLWLRYAPYLPKAKGRRVQYQWMKADQDLVFPTSDDVVHIKAIPFCVIDGICYNNNTGTDESLLVREEDAAKAAAEFASSAIARLASKRPKLSSFQFDHWLNAHIEFQDLLQYLQVVLDDDIIQNSPQSDTCDWILNLGVYQSWEVSPQGVLWLLGPPGTGKSTVLRFLRERFSGQGDDDDMLLHFSFAADDTDLPRTYQEMLLSLLQQLQTYDCLAANLPLTYRPITYVGSRRHHLLDTEIETEGQLSFLLRKVLLTAALKGRTFLVIDAFDRATPTSARKALSFLFYRNSRTRLHFRRLNLLISARASDLLPTSRNGLDPERIVAMEKHNRTGILQYITRDLSNLTAAYGVRLGHPPRLWNLPPSIASYAQGSFERAHAMNKKISKLMSENLPRVGEQHYLQMKLSLLLAQVVRAGFGTEFFLSLDLVCHTGLRSACKDAVAKVGMPEFEMAFKQILQDFRSDFGDEAFRGSTTVPGNILQGEDTFRQLLDEPFEPTNADKESPDTLSAKDLHSIDQSEEQPLDLLEQRKIMEVRCQRIRMLFDSVRRGPTPIRRMDIPTDEAKSERGSGLLNADQVAIKHSPTMSSPLNDIDSKYRMLPLRETEPDTFQKHIVKSLAIKLTEEDWEQLDIDRAREILFNSSAFAKFQLRIQSLAVPFSLQALSRVLLSLPAEEIKFVDECYPSSIMRFQNALELVTDSEWDWWPLSRPEKNKSRTNTRVYWKCHCNTRLWQDIPQGQVQIFQNLLSLSKDGLVQPIHACRALEGRKRCEFLPGLVVPLTKNSLDIAMALSGASILNWYVVNVARNVKNMFFQGTLSKNNSVIIEVLVGAVAGLLTYLAALGFVVRRYSKRRELQSRRTTRSDIKNYTNDPSNFSPASASILATPVRSGGRIQLHGDDGLRSQRNSPQDDNAQRSNMTSTLPSVPIEFPEGQNWSWILLGLEGRFKSFEIDQLECLSIKADHALFYNLKRSYYKLKKPFQRIFSVWKLRNCDVVKYTKPEAYHVFHDLEGPSYPPFDHRYITDYDFEMMNSPPTAHEFEAGFNPCHPACRLVIFHSCVRPRRGDALIRQIPKKKSPWAVAANGDPLEAWGLRVREEPSALKVLAYQVVILIGPFVFWTWWMTRAGHQDDWQNASVPASVVIALQSVFWTQMGVLRLLADVVAKT